MRRLVDGVLLLDKPKGLGSNAALQRVKRLFRAEKAGHGGTLDPLASGLLPLMFGEATKFASRMLDSDKRYVAHIKLGETTATGDAEGPVLDRRTVQVDDQRIEAALAGFRGPIFQIPPMYSALKVQGRPLYELARSGQTVDRAPRQVELHQLKLLSRSGDCLEVEIECSKGTYVRTLAMDLGEVLGTGAHLSDLRRTGAGRFSIEEAVRLDLLETVPDEASLDACLVPLEQLFLGLPRVELNSAESARFRNGQWLAALAAPEGMCGVFTDRGELIGLADMAPDGVLRALRLRSTCAAASG